MAWSNQPLSVFHGTDSLSATAIRLSGINPARFRSQADFGAGFYVTTVLHQAYQWANQRCRRTSGASSAEVLRYEIPRNTMESMRHLTFVVDDDDYYDFIAYCRSGAHNHGPPPRSRPYDLVRGPVSLWPQRLVIAACDQLLFSNPSTIRDFDSPSRSLSPPGNDRFF